MSNLLIIGAGQFGSVVKEIAESVNSFKRIEFVDDNSQKAIGKLSQLKSLRNEFSTAIVALGNAQLRMDCIEKLEALGYEIVTLIHPKAYVSGSAIIEAGSIVEPMAVVQANSKVGKGVLVCSGAVIKHNSVVEDGCYIDCNSTVANAYVPKFTRTVYNQVFKGSEE